jgi:hypothetical protein
MVEWACIPSLAGPCQGPFAHSRYVRQENVAPCQERDEAQVHDPVLANDHAAYGAAQPPVDLPNLGRTLDLPTSLYHAPA